MRHKLLFINMLIATLFDLLAISRQRLATHLALKAAVWHMNATRCRRLNFS